MTDYQPDRRSGRACVWRWSPRWLALAWSASATAGSSVNTGFFGGVAIMGYDTVAYFTDGKATKGSEEFAYDWLGATWYFANAEHRDLFAAEAGASTRRNTAVTARWESPSARAPPTSTPKAWRIVDGKLYLQYSKGDARGVGAGSRRQDRRGRSEVAGDCSQGGEQIRRLVGPCRRNIADSANLASRRVAVCCLIRD